MSSTTADLFAGYGFEEGLVNELLETGRLKKIRAGQLLISPDSPGDEIPFVISGLLKVNRQDADHNEVFLYYLESSETCAMSITCCLEGKRASFKVTAEEDAVLWMVPMYLMERWVSKYPSFRKYVFGSYQTRFDELLYTIDSIVFHNMDERLYRYLLDTKQAKGSFEIRKTHEQIAKELNTSRVVISRLLKQLEKEGKIDQKRNLIEIL